jgi:hypothetical protein
MASYQQIKFSEPSNVSVQADSETSRSGEFQGKVGWTKNKKMLGVSVSSPLFTLDLMVMVP